jgi:MFS family permease
VVGPIVARGVVVVAPMQGAFVVSAVLAAIATAITAATLEEAEKEGTTGHGLGHGDHLAGGMSAGRIVWRIKTSCFATFCYGYFQASVVLFLPLYLKGEKLIEEELVVLVPAFFAGGLLVFSNVAGRIGDRVGHLAVMRVLAVVGGLMVLSFVWLDTFPWMAAAVFVAGGTLATISPVSLGLQGVVVDAGDYGRANGIYNAFYAGGMLMGPPISGLIMKVEGGGAMLVHLAVLWGAFVVFTVVFRRDDPAAR